MRWWTRGRTEVVVVMFGWGGRRVLVALVGNG